MTTTPEQAVIQAVTQEDREAAANWYASTGNEDAAFRSLHPVTPTGGALAQAFAKHRLAAEEQAWREARELVRGTNADLCKGGAGQAYRLIYEALSNAVNNPKLRTQAGRVKNIVAARKAQPLTEPQRLGQEGEGARKTLFPPIDFSGPSSLPERLADTPALSTPAQAEPVAFRYDKYDGEVLFRSSTMKFDPEFWTETPLFAHPPAPPQDREAVVEGVTGIQFNGGHGGNPFVKLYFDKLEDAEAFHSSLLAEERGERS